MDISVVVAAREGVEATVPLQVARTADELGYRELWVGEGPAWDGFVLGMAVAAVTEKAALTIGPVPVSVRDPATISRGAASIAALTGRAVGVALGTSSVRVVERLHGRNRRGAAADLAATAATVRSMIDGRWQPGSDDDPDTVFLRRLGAPTGPLTVAAFGRRAIDVAVRYSDRLLFDLVAPSQVGQLRNRIRERAGGGTVPPLAAWLPASVEPDRAGLRQLLESVAGYLTVAGYREMFESAGFAEAVARAQAGADLAARVDALGVDAAAVVGVVGSRRDVQRRLEEYAAAGLDEIALVPATAGDPGGRRTLELLRRLV